MVCTTLTPPPRVVEGWNICLAMNFRGASASDVQTCTATPRQAPCWNTFRGVYENCSEKIKCRGSSETRFPKVWGRTEPSSGDKQPFKIVQKKELVFSASKMNCRGSSETRFPKVWGQTEPCLRGKWPFKVSKKNRKWSKGNVAVKNWPLRASS